MLFNIHNQRDFDALYNRTDHLEINGTRVAHEPLADGRILVFQPPSRVIRWTVVAPPGAINQNQLLDTLRTNGDTISLRLAGRSQRYPLTIQLLGPPGDRNNRTFAVYANNIELARAPADSFVVSRDQHRPVSPQEDRFVRSRDSFEEIWNGLRAEPRRHIEWHTNYVTLHGVLHRVDVQSSFRGREHDKMHYQRVWYTVPADQWTFQNGRLNFGQVRWMIDNHFTEANLAVRRENGELVNALCRVEIKTDGFRISSTIDNVEVPEAIYNCPKQRIQRGSLPQRPVNYGGPPGYVFPPNYQSTPPSPRMAPPALSDEARALLEADSDTPLPPYRF